MKCVAGVVHHDDQTALLPSDQLHSSSHLSHIRRGEHIAADGGIEQPRTDECCVSGFMAGSSAREQSDFGGGGRSVDDLGRSVTACPSGRYFIHLSALRRI
jgi:hypothetical protein